MKIKVCGLREKENILEVLALGPDYIGLIFYPESKRFAGHNKDLPELLRTVNGVFKTGVFVQEQETVVLETVQRYSLDCVQLHGDESPAFCAAINAVRPVIKAFPVTEKFDFDQLRLYERSCTYFLFDTATPGYGGSGRSFDWDILLQREIPLPFFLSGGIGPHDVAKLNHFRHPQLMAVDVNSAFEQIPGLKNINQLKTFIHAVRN